MVHIAAAPPKHLSAELLKKVASLLGREIVDTRLLLAGEIPRIVSSCPEAGAADSMAQRMREAGLLAFIVEDSELRNRPAGFRAHTARCRGGEVIFGNRLGAEVRVGASDASLIIRGRIQSDAPEKASATKLKLNVAATLLTGGIPIMRRVAKGSAKEPLQVEDFVKIYDRMSSDPRVEIYQNHVDYSFLGPELTPSAAGNFNIAVAKLREWFPSAIFDKRLTGRYKTDASASGPAEALDIGCKLIYLCHLAMERMDSGTALRA